MSADKCQGRRSTDHHLWRSDGRSTVKGGRVYKHHYGFCPETHFPDSPNNPNFPSVVLRKGRQYQTTTVYRFTAE